MSDDFHHQLLCQKLGKALLQKSIFYSKLMLEYTMSQRVQEYLLIKIHKKHGTSTLKLSAFCVNITVNGSSYHKSRLKLFCQHFDFCVLQCAQTDMEWKVHEKFTKPSPSVPKTLHSMPKFAQNIHPYGLFYPYKSAPICTSKTRQLQKRLFPYQQLHRMSIHTSHPSNALYGNSRTNNPQEKEIQIMFQL